MTWCNMILWKLTRLINNNYITGARDTCNEARGREGQINRVLVKLSLSSLFPRLIEHAELKKKLGLDLGTRLVIAPVALLNPY